MNDKLMENDICENNFHKDGCKGCWRYDDCAYAEDASKAYAMEQKGIIKKFHRGDVNVYE